MHDGESRHAPRAASPALARHGAAFAAAGNCVWLIGGGTGAGWRTLFTATNAVERLCLSRRG